MLRMQDLRAIQPKSFVPRTTDSFHSAFLAEFYATTISQRFKEDREKMLAASFEFIRG